MKKYLITVVLALSFIAAPSLAEKKSGKSELKKPDSESKQGQPVQLGSPRSERKRSKREPDDPQKRQPRTRRSGRGINHAQQYLQLDQQVQKARARYNDVSKDLEAIRKLLAKGKTDQALKRIDQLAKKREQHFTNSIKRTEQKRNRIGEILKKQGKTLPKAKNIVSDNEGKKGKPKLDKNKDNSDDKDKDKEKSKKKKKGWWF